MDSVLLIIWGFFLGVAITVSIYWAIHRCVGKMIVDLDELILEADEYREQLKKQVEEGQPEE